MDVLMIFIAIIGIAVSFARKTDKAKAQQRQASAPGKDAVGPKTAVPQSASNRTSPNASAAGSGKFPTASPSKFPPAAAPKRQTAAAQNAQSKPAAKDYSGTPRYTHVVTSTLEGGHTHTESSMTGEESCPPPKAGHQDHPEAAKTPAANVGTLLTFQSSSVLQGVLFSEILGKPKALRRE